MFLISLNHWENNLNIAWGWHKSGTTVELPATFELRMDAGCSGQRGVRAYVPRIYAGVGQRTPGRLMPAACPC